MMEWENYKRMIEEETKERKRIMPYGGEQFNDALGTALARQKEEERIRKQQQELGESIYNSVHDTMESLKKELKRYGLPPAILEYAKAEPNFEGCTISLIIDREAIDRYIDALEIDHASKTAEHIFKGLK